MINKQIIQYSNKQTIRLLGMNHQFIGLFVYMFIGLFVYSITGSIFAEGASAAEHLRIFTIVPPSVDKQLSPGQKSEGVLKVINDSDTTLNFSADIHDYTVEDTNGTPQILQNNTLSKKYSAAAWIGVSPDSFSIPPHEKQLLNYYIQVPQDAKPGGHYAAVVYIPQTQSGGPATGASVNTQAGSLFYITVSGSINEFGKVTQFTAPGFQEYGPVKLFMEIKNLGDLHIKPTGSVVLRDIFNRSLQKSAIDEHNIFPESARDFTALVGSKWMFGRYKAEFLGSYGVNNNLPLTGVVYFWVFPWKLMLIIALIIIAIILALLVMKKKKKQGNTPPSSQPVDPNPTKPETEVKTAEATETPKASV